MAQMLDMLKMLLENLVELGILVFEFTGVGVIIGTSLVSLYKFLTRKPDTRIYLAKGLAMGLEFKLGSEILPHSDRAGVEGDRHRGGHHRFARGADLLIHWEIRQEEKSSSGDFDTIIRYFEEEEKMSLAELFILAVGLSMDAFAVSVCKGIVAGKNQTQAYVPDRPVVWRISGADAPGRVFCGTFLRT